MELITYVKQFHLEMTEKMPFALTRRNGLYNIVVKCGDNLNNQRKIFGDNYAKIHLAKWKLERRYDSSQAWHFKANCV